MVIDRGGITCLGKSQAKLCVAEVNRVLIDKGYFYFSPYSDQHSQFISNEVQEDELVRLKNKEIKIRFYSKKDIYQVASFGWGIIDLNHRTITNMTTDQHYVTASWQVTLQKM